MRRFKETQIRVRRWISLLGTYVTARLPVAEMIHAPLPPTSVHWLQRAVATIRSSILRGHLGISNSDGHREPLLGLDA